SLADQRSHPRVLMERAALAFLSYSDENEDGFRILVRDSPGSHAVGTFSSVLTDVAQRVEEILATQLRRHRYPPRDAALYAQLLGGMVAYTGQWWLGTRKPSKAVVAARMVTLSWYGLSALQKKPPLRESDGG